MTKATTTRQQRSIQDMVNTVDIAEKVFGRKSFTVADLWAAYRDNRKQYGYPTRNRGTVIDAFHDARNGGYLQLVTANGTAPRYSVV